MAASPARLCTRLLPIALIASALSACNSVPLKDDERHDYDGWWTANIQKTPATQTQNSWRMQCNNLEGEFAFEVVDGVVLMNLLGVPQEAELGRGGKFRIDQVSDLHVAASAGSDVPIDDGRVTYVIKGKLGGANPKGSIQDWVPEIGAGCITKIRYTRDGE